MRRLPRQDRFRPSVAPLESRLLMAATPGTIDPTFAGGQGAAVVPAFTTTEQDGSVPFEEATDTAVQPDGKILLVGAIGQSQAGLIAVARLDADGTPDTTFGQDGKATITAGRLADTEGVVVRPDGKIVIVAEVFPVAPAVNVGQAEVVQLNADGSLDAGFGQGGQVIFNVGTAAEQASDETPEISAAGLLPDGKVIVAGTAFGSFFAARLDTDGSLDTTFGTGGQAFANASPAIDLGSSDLGASLAIQADGKLVLAGETISATTPGEGMFPNFFYDLAVVRLDADGSLDTTFGGPKASSESSPGNVILPPVEPGTATDPGNASASGVAIQADGKIVLGGNDNDQTVATRLNTDGSLDTSFGNMAGREFISGVPETGFNGSISTSIGIGPDGRILLVGNGLTSAESQFPLIRLDADGSPDPTFGDPATPGIAVVSIPSPGRFGVNGVGLGSHEVSFTPDGQVVLGGTAYPGTGPPQGNQYHFGAIRIIYGPVITPTPTPTPALQQPPADFDGSGRTNFAIYYANAGAFLTQPSNGGPVVTTSFGVAGAGQSIPAPADYTGAGHAEIAVYIPSQGVYAIRPDSGPDMLVPFGIPGTGQSLPAPGDYEGTGKDDIAVYLPSIGAFGIRPSSDPSGASDKIIPFGIAGAGQSLPAPADYFGTGVDDLAVYLPSIGAFAIRPPDGSADQIIPFGLPGIGQSIPIPGDYDGSGHVELAVYMPAPGLFAYRPYNGGPDVIEAFGTAGDGSIPVPGDYSGSGHDEIAVYDPNYAAFAYRPGNGGADVTQVFGTIGLTTSLPAAAPAGAISGEVQVASGTSASANASAASVTITRASAIPRVATAAASNPISGRRAAPTLVAQAAGDRPFELT